MLLLVIRTAPVKPVLHSLLTTYWHLLAPTATLLEEELFIDELLLVLSELELEDLILLEVEVEVEVLLPTTP
jgi:hypothetical protein